MQKKCPEFEYETILETFYISLLNKLRDTELDPWWAHP